MLETFFKGVFDSDITPVISVHDFLLCLLVSAVLGVLIALAYMWNTRYTKSFVVTLALLPSVVCVVIMMVNGNVGTGVAVAGAFSLVRFRSVPGSAREICALFFGMATGLITGMGYLAYGALFAVAMCVLFLLYSVIGLGDEKRFSEYKTVNVTIPEGLDYTGVFDDIFKEHCRTWELVRVKSTNMGSMFRLTYDIRLLDASREKEMIDKIRCRNGNLEISVSKRESAVAEL